MSAGMVAGLSDVSTDRNYATIYSFVANTGFIFLFAVSVSYFLFVSRGLIPAALGGFYPLVSVALLLPLMITFLFSCRYCSLAEVTLNGLLLAFCCLLAVVSAVGYSLGADSETVKNHLVTVVYYLSVFLVFRGLNPDSTGFRSCLVILFAFNAGLIFIESRVGYFRLLLGMGDNSTASYQFIGVSLLLTGSVLAIKASTVVRYLIHASVISLLFLNGARTEFFLYILFLMIIEAFLIRSKAVRMSILATLCSTFAVLFFWMRSLVETNRVASLIGSGITKSSSFVERNQAFFGGIRTIRESPALGEYASYEVGHYIHNGLSAWVDLGFPGFVLFSLISLGPLVWVCWYIWTHKKCSDEVLYLLCLAVGAAMSAFLTKSFSYILFPAAYGLFVKGVVRSGLQRSAQKKCA